MDVSPGLILKLLLLGALVAAVPLSFVWVRGDAVRYRKLVWVTLFLTFDLIVFGAFTRLTDSGLGCPDWPGCYGKSDPLTAAKEIRAAEALNPHGPVTMTKATIEMIHRYLAMAVGALILALAAMAWAKRRELRASPWPSTWLFVLVCIQGAFGAWTVTLRLMPIIVTIHLLLGMTLLGALAWLAARERYFITHAVGALAGLRGATILGLALLIAQIALGGWVSTNYAALACPDLPLCQAQVVPPMDFKEGFSLWRDLGRSNTGALLQASALTAMHWSHRVGALIVFLYLGWLGSKALTLERLHGVASRHNIGRWLLWALTTQIVLGLSVVQFGHPVAIATLHNACATLLVGVMVVMLSRTRAK